ncbi:hypothetical protein Celaphus_00014889, partial [Cervus elaphus hippelaphus]
MDPCAAPKEDFYSTGVQTEARVADSLDTIRARGMLVASSSGAVELWVLDKNETFIGSKFYKVLGCGTHAVRGNKDFCIKIRDLVQQMVLNPDRVRTVEFYWGYPCPKAASTFLPPWLDIFGREKSLSPVIRSDCFPCGHQECKLCPQHSCTLLGRHWAVGWDHQVSHRILPTEPLLRVSP